MSPAVIERAEQIVAEQLPLLCGDFGTPVDGASGRGLLLVAALADRWGVEAYPPSGKTMWAEAGPRPSRVGGSSPISLPLADAT